MLGHPVQQVAAAVAALVKPQPDFARARRYLAQIDQDGLRGERQVANDRVRGIPAVSSTLPRVGAERER